MVTDTFFSEINLVKYPFYPQYDLPWVLFLSDIPVKTQQTLQRVVHRLKELIMWDTLMMQALRIQEVARKCMSVSRHCHCKYCGTVYICPTLLGH